VIDRDVLDPALPDALLDAVVCEVYVGGERKYMRDDGEDEGATDEVVDTELALLANDGVILPAPFSARPNKRTKRAGVAGVAGGVAGVAGGVAGVAGGVAGGTLRGKNGLMSPYCRYACRCCTIRMPLPLDALD
jgi:hypothetical protein